MRRPARFGLGERMRDEEYAEVMLEAYRDVLAHILEGEDIKQLHEYVHNQVLEYKEWLK